MNDSMLERRHTTIALGGSSYVWEEPCRRDSRRWAAELEPAQAILARATSGSGSLTDVADLCDLVLDFFYRHHPEMARDQARLDDATEADIMTAFAALSEFCWSPLLTAAAAEAPPVTPSPETSGTNSEPTNSCSPSGESPGTTSTPTGPTDNSWHSHAP